MSTTLARVITQLEQAEEPSEAEFAEAFRELLSPKASTAQIKRMLSALSKKPIDAPSLTAAVHETLAASQPFAAPSAVADTCGTGGDGQHSLNVSTAVAIVAASCGLPIAKHGNRSVTSRCGSADVLESLGVAIDAPAENMARALRETQICFLMAPRYHPALARIGPVRKALGVRTVFNVLGPLCNPARPAFQLIGVYDAALMRPVAQCFQAIGGKRAWVVHAHDGMDEISLSGVTDVLDVTPRYINSMQIIPEDAGIKSSRAPLVGGSAADNAEALRRLLAGEAGPYRDCVLLNTAAILVVAGAAQNIKSGAQHAAQAIDSGRAAQTLERFITCSRGWQ